MDVEEFRRMYYGDHSWWLYYNDKLLDAVLNRRIDDVRHLLEIGVPANADNSYAARKAADLGYVDIVAMLYKYGSRVVITYDYLLLCAAIMAKDFEFAMILFRACPNKRKALDDSIRTNRPRVVEFIAAHHSVDCAICMGTAISCGSIESVDLFIRRGVIPRPDDWKYCMDGACNGAGTIRCFLSHGLYDDRINPYDYVGSINESHYSHLPEILKRVVVYRQGMAKRMLRYPTDVIVVHA